MKIRYTAKSINYIHAVDVIMEAGASGARCVPTLERRNEVMEIERFDSFPRYCVGMHTVLK